MKTKLLDINGKEKKIIDLPKAFSKKIRGDIVSKVIEIKRTEQPFSPSPVAGKQHSASGIIVHRRHVWKSGYGRGMSRVPRKIMTRRGTQFHWVGAEVSNTVGGRRPHSPKVEARINTKKANKKEFRIAFESALSATANGKEISKRYKRLNEKDIKDIPFVVDSKISSLKTKEIISSVKKILGTDLFEVALKSKKVRSGRGKRRGRKYKSNAGLLIVIGNEEKLKINAFEVVKVKDLSIANLANGGLGRLTLYTEESIEDIKKLLNKKEKKDE